MSTTRDRILELALSRFNEDGLNAVAVRDLAHELELSPGNVTYYFPKKEDLVRELTARLSKLNDENYACMAEATELGDILEAVRRGLQNLHQYRFFSLSVVQVLSEYPSVAEGYREVESRRRNDLRGTLASLQRRGMIRADVGPAELDRTARVLAMLVRFSLPDQAVRLHWQQEAPLSHYLALVAQTLRFVASDAAQAQLEPYLRDATDPAAVG